MAKVIHCDCGEIVRAEPDDELVATVEDHMDEARPELVGEFSRRHAHDGDVGFSGDTGRSLTSI